MSELNLAHLAEKLKESHSEAMLQEIRSFSASLKDSRARLSTFNADNALLRSPITSEEAMSLGFTSEDDRFTLLQGDVVSTDSAFLLGERVTGNPKYVVLNSTCDLVPNRRTCVAVLRLLPIKSSEMEAKAKLNLLLKFARIDSMYLPPLPIDGRDVVGNAIVFDGICQIRSFDLLLATRIASLSFVGWRIFGAFARTVLARSNPRETLMREAVNAVPEQQAFPGIS